MKTTTVVKDARWKFWQRVNLPSFLRSKRVLGILAVVTLIAVALLLFLYFRQAHKSSTEYKSALSTADSLSQASLYGQSNTGLESYYESHPHLSPNDKQMVAMRIGGNYLADGNGKKALEWYRTVYAIRDGDLDESVILQQLSAAAIKAGDKKTAIEYLQKLINVSKTNADKADDEYIPAYEANIKELQK